MPDLKGKDYKNSLEKIKKDTDDNSVKPVAPDKTQQYVDLFKELLEKNKPSEDGTPGTPKP